MKQRGFVAAINARRESRQLNLTEFARDYGIKLSRDENGELVVKGNLGHIYEYSREELGVCFIPPYAPGSKRWSNAREKCVVEGMTLRQNGDHEGCLSFDPTNAVLARLAIRLLGIRKRRRLSRGRIALQVAILAEFRARTKQERLSSS